MDSGLVPAWSADWAWGLPLIVLTVILHAYGLGQINKDVISRLSRHEALHARSPVAIFVVGGTALSATMLHALEGALWAIVYRLLGATQDYRSAMLYSLSAMTSYGHENIFLAQHWQMMGALEALNGWILFGLTTAFLFSVVQRAWPQAYAGQPSRS
jgi:hypothetical protein